MACGGNSMFEISVHDQRALEDCSFSSPTQFPLVAGGRAFTGGDPGPDRVIFNESRILCA
jgi:hypothetical protein